MGDKFATIVAISADVKSQIVQTKATCPFIGTAVSTGDLPVRNDADNPLASVDDVRALGNTGGGDLGELLQLFATGNHLLMRGSQGRLDTKAPAGLFSLEFPGSQGSHPGHSGILQGDPQTLASGRLSLVDFERLTRRARAGVVTRSDVARFIAENLHRDPNSRVFGTAAAALLFGDLSSFVGSIGPTLVKKLGASEASAADAQRGERPPGDVCGQTVSGRLEELEEISRRLGHEHDRTASRRGRRASSPPKRTSLIASPAGVSRSSRRSHAGTVQPMGQAVSGASAWRMLLAVH